MLMLLRGIFFLSLHFCSFFFFLFLRVTVDLSIHLEQMDIRNGSTLSNGAFSFQRTNSIACSFTKISFFFFFFFFIFRQQTHIHIYIYIYIYTFYREIVNVIFNVNRIFVHGGAFNSDCAQWNESVLIDELKWVQRMKLCLECEASKLLNVILFLLLVVAMFPYRTIKLSQRGRDDGIKDTLAISFFSFIRVCSFWTYLKIAPSAMKIKSI